MISIQQAAINSLSAWIGSQMDDVTVLSSWPSPDFPPPNKSITILTAGPRQDESIPLRYIGQEDGNSPNTTATWQIKVCEQNLQLDIWADSDVERDDIIARLDTVLNAGEAASGIGTHDPVGSGVLLAVADGFPMGTTADFTFEGPDTEDSPESISRSEYRATIRGTAYLGLTVNAVSAKQIVINLKQKLHDGDTADSGALYDIATLTPSGQTGSTGT